MHTSNSEFKINADDLRKTLSAQSSPEEKSRRLKASREMQDFLKNKYFKSIGSAVQGIGEILTKYNFDPVDLFGIYTGESGKTHDKVGENTWIVLTWHKMESGNFEIVSYLS